MKKNIKTKSSSDHLGKSHKNKLMKILKYFLGNIHAEEFGFQYRKLI